MGAPVSGWAARAGQRVRANTRAMRENPDASGVTVGLALALGLAALVSTIVLWLMP